MTIPPTIEQPTLFGEDFLPEPVPGAQPDWRAFKHTGERIKAGFPEKYAAIVAELGQGTKYRQIMRMFGVNFRTVIAIRMAELGTVEKIREHAARGFHEIAEAARERLAEALANPEADIDPKDLAWIADKSSEKAELLTGHATARVENIAPIPADDDLMMTNFRDRYAKPIDAEIVEPKPAPAQLPPPNPDDGLGEIPAAPASEPSTGLACQAPTSDPTTTKETP